MCSDCGKGFTNSGDLNKHRMMHTGKKPHVCSDCGKGFISPSDLKLHVRTHTGEKPHVCSHCSRGFANHSNLKKHLKIHSSKEVRKTVATKKTITHTKIQCYNVASKSVKQLPHGCSYCDQRFSHLSLLTEHMRTHSFLQLQKCTVSLKRLKSKDIYLSSTACNESFKQDERSHPIACETHKPSTTSCMSVLISDDQAQRPRRGYHQVD